ncbi:MAG: hypothetical protein ABJM44_00635, partial [Marinomonas sp.]
QRATRQTLLDQHRVINNGLQTRDASKAQAAVEAHLDYVERCLQNQIRAEQNEEVAQQRLDHTAVHR